MQRLPTAVSTLCGQALRPAERHPREQLLSADQFRPASVSSGSTRVCGSPTQQSVVASPPPRSASWRRRQFAVPAICCPLGPSYGQSNTNASPVVAAPSALSVWAATPQRGMRDRRAGSSCGNAGRPCSRQPGHHHAYDVALVLASCCGTRILRAPRALPAHSRAADSGAQPARAGAGGLCAAAVRDSCLVAAAARRSCQRCRTCHWQRRVEVGTPGAARAQPGSGGPPPGASDQHDCRTAQRCPHAGLAAGPSGRVQHAQPPSTRRLAHRTGVDAFAWLRFALAVAALWCHCAPGAGGAAQLGVPASERVGLARMGVDSRAGPGHGQRGAAAEHGARSAWRHWCGACCGGR